MKFVPGRAADAGAVKGMGVGLAMAQGSKFTVLLPVTREA